MNIGVVAKASGVSAKMIRYYEDIGLLPESARSSAGYRCYGERDLHVLRFVRQSRDLGFKIDDIRRLLMLWQDRSRNSADVKAIALDHVRALDQRIADLSEMRAALANMADACQGDDRPDCAILDTLATTPCCAASSNETAFAARPDVAPEPSMSVSRQGI